MRRLWGRVCTLAALAMLGVGSGTAAAGTVTVLTAMSMEMMQAYQKAFEAEHPGTYLEFIGKGTPEALEYLEQQPAGRRPDVVWFSSPMVLEAMGQRKLLTPSPQLRNPKAPARLGSLGLQHPQGLYHAQSLAGYGIMWNPQYLHKHQLRPPQQWGDLAQATYHGHLGLGSTAHSGTALVVTEMLLQSEGWGPGWGRMLQIAGNARGVGQGSFLVPRAIMNGEYGLGMVIDAQAQAGKYSGYPVDFVYPRQSSLLPVGIALVAGGRNPTEARQFIAFTLSTAGQKLLLDARVNRLPVLPYSNLPIPAGYPDVQEISQRSQLVFDLPLATERQVLVARLYEQIVVQPLAALQAATRAIQRAESAALLREQPQAQQLIAQARQLAYAPPLREAQWQEATLRRAFQIGQNDEEALRRRTHVEAGWLADARSRYAQARQLAERAWTVLQQP